MQAIREPKEAAKLYNQEKDNKIKQAIGEVLGEKAFKYGKWKGQAKSDMEKLVEDAESFMSGRLRKPEKKHIGDVVTTLMNLLCCVCVFYCFPHAGVFLNNTY